jgi:DNA-directed RNA polymerase subunit alpha
MTATGAVRLTYFGKATNYSCWINSFRRRRSRHGSSQEFNKSIHMSEATVAAINERAAEEWFRKGKEAEDQGNHEKAMGFYERSLGENPDHEDACFHLAVLYDRRAEDAKAIELYERLCTSEPVHVNALVNLALLYEDNNHYEEAHRCLEAVLTTNPNHERARLYMKDVESARSMYYDDDSDRRGDRRSTVLEIPLGDFELSVRSRNCLKKMNLHTLGDLLRTSEQELLGYKNFGETSLNEIKALLAQKGLRLGQNADESKLTVKRPSAPVAGDVPAEVMGKNVSELELSVRSRKALQRLNINTIGELISRTEEELLGCKNFGQTSLNEIKQQLGNFGVGLRKLPE